MVDETEKMPTVDVNWKAEGMVPKCPICGTSMILPNNVREHVRVTWGQGKADGRFEKDNDVFVDKPTMGACGGIFDMFITQEYLLCRYRECPNCSFVALFRMRHIKDGSAEEAI